MPRASYEMSKYAALTDADEDMVFRHVHGPRIRLTSYGRAEQARMAAAIHERYGL
jgi:hypothetical protein